jgi:DNA mismatch endonuclease (patch repair protein)
MVSNSRRESQLEQSLRSELFRRGLRFRKHLAVVSGLRCKPDIVFTRAKVAVFVDGCFWHACPEHGTLPQANAEWWAEKLRANVARDQLYDSTLQKAGWTVLRFWEHQAVVDMANEIERTVRQPR